MQATTEHQQFPKDRGESGRQEGGLTPLVKKKWAHKHNTLSSSAQTFTYLRLTFGMGILRFAASASLRE